MEGLRHVEGERAFLVVRGGAEVDVDGARGLLNVENSIIMRLGLHAWATSGSFAIIIAFLTPTTLQLPFLLRRVEGDQGHGSVHCVRLLLAGAVGILP